MSRGPIGVSSGPIGVRRGRLGLLLALALLATACGRQDVATGPAGDVVSGEVLVFAAASLSDVFAALEPVFEARHPGADLVVNLAGSQTLATQLLEGAPGDVFVSADVLQLDRVADAGLLAGPWDVVATNGLAIAVEPGNPTRVSGLADLSDPARIVVLPGEQVPAGRYAREALAAAGVEVTPASLEPDVRATLARVALGEADAAIVYRSDVTGSAGRVDGVPLPPSLDVVATYPAGILAAAPNAVGAAALVVLLLDDAGRAALVGAGFGAAP